MKIVTQLIQDLRGQENELLIMSAPDSPSEETIECLKVLGEAVEKLRWLQAELIAIEREKFDKVCGE